MKIKTSELTGRALSYAVAMAENERFLIEDGRLLDENRLEIDYTSQDLAAPIIERKGIVVEPFKSTTKWSAFKFATGDCAIAADTPEIAAMRCYVGGKFGDEVEVPDELCVVSP